MSPPGQTSSDASTRNADTSLPDDDVAPETVAAVELLRERGRAVRDEEVGEALAVLDLSENEEAAVTALADRLVGRLLSTPLERLANSASDEELARDAAVLFSD